MATANVTGDGQQKNIEDLACSTNFTAGLHGQLTFISVLNSFFLRHCISWEYSDPSCPSQD